MLKLSEIKHQASIFLPFPSVENCRLPIIHLLVRRSFDDSSEINFSKSKREGFSNGGGGGEYDSKGKLERRGVSCNSSVFSSAKPNKLTSWHWEQPKQLHPGLAGKGTAKFLLLLIVFSLFVPVCCTRTHTHTHTHREPLLKRYVIYLIGDSPPSAK